MSIIESIIEKMQNFNKENLIDLAISAIVIILCFMMSKFISYLIIKLFSLKEKDKRKIKANAFYKPIAGIIKITGIYVAIMLLNVSDEAKVTLVKLYKVGLIVCAANGFANILHPKSAIFAKLEEKTNYSGDKQLNNFVSKIIKVVIYIIAAYLVFL